MSAQDLTLNIAVNLGRLARWAMEGKRNRLDQFILETQDFITQLDQAPKQIRFQKTFDIFKQRFSILKSDVRLDLDWAEEVLTWANILTHRAKLA